MVAAPTAERRLTTTPAAGTFMGSAVTPPSSNVAVPIIRWAATGYVPNGWAYRNVHTRLDRFIAGVTSRQVGKTTTGVEWIDESMRRPANHFGPPEVGVLSFDYAHAYMPVERWLQNAIFADGRERYYINRNDHVIRDRVTGARLRWFSADDPYAIAGPTLSDLLIDEAQKVPDLVWAKGRPTLNARTGRVLAFGTPDITVDQTWFRGLWMRGQEGEYNYHSFTVDCFENRWITLEEIRDARSSISESEFRMLYLGQWVAVNGAVFRRFRHCFAGDWQEPERDGRYIMAVDLAQENDYTVAYIMDTRNNAVVHEYRVNQLDYVDVEDALEELYHRYRCSYLVIDATREVAVADALRRRHLVVRPFIFSSKSKNALVSNLNRMLEHGRLVLPATAEGLERELGVYMRKVSVAGNVRYSAPVNYFDDRVMALGMAALQIRGGGYASVGSQTQSYATFGGGSDDAW